MEKNINKNLMTISPLVLAYLGDTVYETYIRSYLIKNNNNKKVNDLHKLAINHVKARAQADIVHKLESELTEEEYLVYKKGRNQKSHSSPKNGDIIDYKHATGFEALVGYLYLDGQGDRLDYLVKRSIEFIEENLK